VKIDYTSFYLYGPPELKLDVRRFASKRRYYFYLDGIENGP